MRKSLSLLLAFLGLFVSLYLLWVYTSAGHAMVCVGSGCDTVRLSEYSHVRGIPMPMFGVLGYLLIAILIAAEALVSPARALDIRYALAGATGFGFLYSLYLEYLQGFVIHAFCAWCVTSGIVMTALAVLSIYNLVRPEPLTDKASRIRQVRSYRTIILAALVIGIPGFYELAKHGEAPPTPPPAPTASTQAMLVRPDSHISGNPNATVTVVEFGDFECPVCKREEPVAKALRDKYKDKIRFVFRQFPLIHTHPFAERMAEASECAADQGKFWEAVEAIYAHQDDLSENSLRLSAKEIGLDMGKFNQCLDSGAEKARVDRDRADGKALGVNATPTFFVGHQVLQGVPEPEEFSKAINHELATQASGSPTSPGKQEAPTSANSSSPASGKTPANDRSQAASSTPASGDPSASGFGLFNSPGGAFGGLQTGVACSEEDAAKKQPTLINSDQLKQMIAGNSQILFVDVRTAQEHAAASIPGSINIPVDDMPKQWSTLPKDKTIVFYESGASKGDICASGRAAGRILLEHGYLYDHVKVFQDGLLGWQKSGLVIK